MSNVISLSNNNNLKKAFPCSNKCTARNYINTSQFRQWERIVKNLTCDWSVQQNTDCVTTTSLPRLSPSPLTSRPSGLMENKSKEQNVFAATECEQGCKMITGDGSPRCIPASEQLTFIPSESFLLIHMDKQE